MQFRFLLRVAVAVTLASPLCFAQSEPPSAPAPQQTPSAPAPAVSAEPQFPPVSEANFDAPAPTKADVESFLKTSWGYDPNRVWEIFSILKTPAPNVSKVTILVAEKQTAQQIATLAFFVTPDGKHLIAQDAVLDFGPHPYANNYRILQQRADGPSRGASAKQFELVEFADFQCPHCKEAQSIGERLVQDFPQAHFVFENFPLVTIHPSAYKAAAWGACVAEQGGSEAFFKYAGSVFGGQESLAGQGADQTLRNAATAAGADPEKVAACADSSTGKSAVDASMRLGQELNVDQTPMLFIDGRGMPMLAVSYEQLKTIVEYQFSMDK
ncbi:MAG TPA: thioredoxin domain-containing protein [Acidobacteriaceae bacterium]|jgi:protein-disulfide isomerase